MAGGTVLVLARHGGPAVAERGLGSGIHGGEIVLRGRVDPAVLGVGAMAVPLDAEARDRTRPLIEAYGEHFDVDVEPLLADDYTRIVPASTRPFANKYAWE
jgi:glutamate synthase domain-containing protein 3